jgi:RNA polymerase sigma factor (sigma-70 family)
MTLTYRGGDEQEREQEEAFERLSETIRLHGARVFGYVRHLVKRTRLSPAAPAEDIWSDLLLLASQRIVRSPASLPPNPDRFAAWLMRAALYICLNKARRERTERESLAEYGAIVAEEELSGLIEEEPLARLELHSLLDMLEPEERNILRMSIVEGRTSGDIANALGLTSANVRQMKRRAIAKVRQALSG